MDKKIHPSIRRALQYSIHREKHTSKNIETKARKGKNTHRQTERLVPVREERL